MRTLIASTLFFGWSLFAGQVSWIKLSPVIVYRDISTYYQTRDPYTFHLGVELSGEKVIAAFLRSDIPFSATPSFTFAKEDLGKFEVEIDDKSRVWVTRLPVSYLLANWMIFQTGTDWSNDRPSQPLATLGPASTIYEFPDEPPLPEQLKSGRHDFSGTRKDGRAFQAKILLIQEL